MLGQIHTYRTKIAELTLRLYSGVSLISGSFVVEAHMLAYKNIHKSLINWEFCERYRLWTSPQSVVTHKNIHKYSVCVHVTLMTASTSHTLTCKVGELFHGQRCQTNLPCCVCVLTNARCNSAYLHHPTSNCITSFAAPNIVGSRGFRQAVQPALLDSHLLLQTTQGIIWCML